MCNAHPKIRMFFFFIRCDRGIGNVLTCTVPVSHRGTMCEKEKPAVDFKRREKRTVRERVLVGVLHGEYAWSL